MPNTILVVEDDDAIRDAVVESLKLDGYEVNEAASLDEALRLTGDDPSLIVLDVMLPDGTGLELLKGLRERGSPVPVLMLTARGTEEDRILGFEHGCDDYVVKPFSLKELRLRIRALLRRPSAETPTPPPSGDLQIGRAKVDLEGYRVEKDGQVRNLSPKEKDMIAMFLSEPGIVITRHRFLNEVWGYDRLPTTRTVDMHLRKIRQKIEDDPDQPRHFVTVHGAGYRFDP